MSESTRPGATMLHTRQIFIRSSRASLEVAAAAAITLAVSACGAPPDSGSPSETAGQGGNPNETDLDDFDPGVADALSIEPATASLLSENGSNVSQSFRVFLKRTTGARVELPSTELTWEFDAFGLGEMDQDAGRFTANGLVGGVGTLRATWKNDPTVSGGATLQVRLERELKTAGVPSDVSARFEGSLLVDAPAAAANLVYPLDNAVMPQNAYPANVQWTRGDEGDMFRITLEKPNVRIVSFVVNDSDATNSWLVEDQAWRSLAQSDPDDLATLTVDRWSSADGRAASGQTAARVKFAKAALTGSVYYWDVEAGRVRRIDDGVGEAIDFMPSPPTAGDGSDCIGCHSVSTSGRYLAGRLGGGDNNGAIFDLTTKLTAAPAPTVYPVSNTITWWETSWSPDDTRLIASDRIAGTDDTANYILKLYDPLTGAELPTTGDMPGGIQPAWSPDGSQVAYVANPNDWGGALTSSDIGVFDVSGPDEFGEGSLIHVGKDFGLTPEDGNSDSYPTWSPDSTRIAFAHGTGSRSEQEDTGSHRSGLYVMDPDGDNLVRLDRACGRGGQNPTDATNTTDALDNFQPNFSPFDEGDYYWMSFLSRRDYGNALVGTRGTGRQQIWVTAIRKGADPGDDASEVAYWLPGQDTASKNISAFWAPRPCRDDAESCSVNSECCGGDCRPDAEGDLVCSPPPPERCRDVNQTCGSAADCCEERECVGNVCVDPVVK
jgi:hypothetical protein